MSGTFRWQSPILVALGCAAPGLAFAQSSEPGLRTVEANLPAQTPAPTPAPARPTPRIEVAPRAPSSHVFEAYRIYADSATSFRIAGGIGALVVAASTAGAGIYANAHDDDGFGTALLVTGGVVAGIGALSLVLPSEAERVAKANGVDRVTAPTAEQEQTLAAEWARIAREARSARHLGAGIGFVLSGASFVLAGVYAASNGIDDDTQAWVVPSLLVSGGAFASGGLATLMMQSPAETSYAAFRVASAKPGASGGVSSLRLGAARLPNGGWVGFVGNF